MSHAETDIVAESAPYPTPCIECGTTTVATLTEALVGTHHRWDLDGCCSACGAVWTSCDDLPQAGFREAILAANGPVVLRTRDCVPIASLMRTLRVVRSLSLVQAAGDGGRIARVRAGGHTG